MTPEDWKFVLEQTGVAGVCFTFFILGLHRRWWVMGSEADYLREIADRFMTIADRAISQVEMLTKRSNE